MEIDTMEVMEDHVHVFVSAPPRYSPARVMQIMKSITAREIFARFPWVRRKLWGGEFWGDGYFVRSIGDQVTESPAACCGDIYFVVIAFKGG
jgi:putative transposase